MEALSGVLARSRRWTCEQLIDQADAGRRRSTRFVFLTPDYPPAPAIARVCTQHGAVLFPREEETIEVGRTIVAMLPPDPRYRRPCGLMLYR